MKIKMRRGRKERSILFFIILFFLATAALGVAIGKWIIIPYIFGVSDDVLETEKTPRKGEMQDSANNPSKKLDKKDFVVPSITFYKIQIGAFKEFKNAQEMALQMQSLGYISKIIEEDYYRVISSAYTDNKKADAEREILKKNGLDCNIKRWDSPDIEITYTENFHDYIISLDKCINLFIQCIQEESDILYKMKHSGVSTLELNKEIDNIGKKLNQLNNILENKEYPAKLEQVFGGIESIKNEYIDHLTECKKHLNSDKIDSVLNDGYMDIVACTEEFYYKISNLK